MNQQRHIILFDGVCNLCNSSVQAVIKKDKKNIFKFASLQSEAGKKLLKEMGLAENHLASFVYVKGNQYFLKSDAALEVSNTLGGPWKLFYWLKIIPAALRNAVYNLVAKNRYKWFGEKNECMVPTAEMRNKFL